MQDSRQRHAQYSNPNAEPGYSNQAQNVHQSQSYQPYAYSAPPVDLNNPMIQLAAASGAQFFDSGHKMIEDNVQQFVSFGILRYYFNLDTNYVLRKLGVLVWPFQHKHWHRQKDMDTSSHGYVPPRHDVNAPDLYIPVMGLVTYIIAAGIGQGWTKSFTPEVLGTTASRGLALVALEVFILKVPGDFVEAGGGGGGGGAVARPFARKKSPLAGQASSSRPPPEHDASITTVAATTW